VGLARQPFCARIARSTTAAMPAGSRPGGARTLKRHRGLFSIALH